MATKKKAAKTTSTNKKKPSLKKKSVIGKKSAPKKPAAKKLGAKKSAAKKSAAKKSAAKKSAKTKRPVAKKTPVAKKKAALETKPVSKKKAASAKSPARGEASKANVILDTDRRGLGADSAGQSGDTQGLSRREYSNSESVEELLEEGQYLEAEAVAGVEDALDPDQGEVRTKEFLEDDVPGEYTDKD
jgi:hypothetical protein